MDKYEYKVRAEEIKQLIADGDYPQAAEIADTIDWRRVKSVMMLCTISDLYKINRRFEDARDILLLANERRPGGRTICYSLCELFVKTEEYVQAVEYYKEFVLVAPKDPGRYILQYKLYEAQDVSLEERIAVLEELKKRDYREKWAYELAYLYHRIGLATRCVEECDELILWFGEGKYVIKAMELKMLHQPLSREQQEKYDNRFAEKPEPVYEESEDSAEDGQEEQEPDEESEDVQEETALRASDIETATTKIVPFKDIRERLFGDTKVYPPIDKNVVSGQEENASDTGNDMDIQVKVMDMGKFNTMNLQETVAEGIKAFLGEKDGKEAESEEVYEPEGTVEPEEAYGSEEVIEYEETYEPEEIIEYEETYEPEEVIEYEETYEPEEVIEFEDTYGSEDNTEDSVLKAIIQPMFEGDTESLNYPEIEEVDVNDLDPYSMFERIESTEVFFGETGELETVPMDEAFTEEAAYTEPEGIVEEETYTEPEEIVEEATYTEPEEIIEEETYTEPEGIIEEETYTEPERILEEEIYAGQEADFEENIAIEQGNVSEKINDIKQQVLEDKEKTDTTAAVVMEQIRRENEAAKLAMAAQPPKEIADVLSQESDGQISIVMPENQSIEKQITGQMNFQDVLAEWERMKRENAEKREEELRQHVLQQTGDMFTEFEAAVRDGLLEKLESENDEAAEEVMEEIMEETVEQSSSQIISISELLRRELNATVIHHDMDVKENSDIEPMPERIRPIEAEEPEYEEAQPIEEEEPEYEQIQLIEPEPEYEQIQPIEEPEPEYEQVRPIEESEPEYEQIQPIEESEPEYKQIQPIEETESVYEQVQPIEAAEELPAAAIVSGTNSAEDDESDFGMQFESIYDDNEKRKGESDASAASRPEKNGKEVRALTKEEKELFASFIQSRQAREQLVNVIDNISMAAYTGNVIITGEEGTDTVTLARNIIKDVKLSDSNCSGRVAKISASSLSNKNAEETLNQLANGALIVQKASNMSAEAVKSFYNEMQRDNYGIVVILEDTPRAMDRFLEKYKDFAKCFTNRMDIMALDNDTLVEFGRRYAHEREYAIDDFGILALHTRIDERQTLDHAVTVVDVKEIVDNAIMHANKRSFGHFIDILFAKRYDEEDMIILGEKDFI